MEESRDQFEEWFMERKYHIVVREFAWKAWQASRAAIEIELPNGVTTREALDAGYMSDYAAGMDDGIEDCAKSIRAAGLKIKGE